MKESGKIALGAFAVGAFVAGGAYWLLPIFPLWIYVIIGLAAAGSACDQGLKMAANEKIVDRGDWPTEKDHHSRTAAVPDLPSENNLHKAPSLPWSRK